MITSEVMQARVLASQPSTVRSSGFFRRAERSSDAATVRFEGALDALTVTELRRVIADVLSAGPKDVVVDLGRVTLMDSTGVGAIVSLFKRLKAEGGTLRVVGAHGQPLAVLKLLKLDTVFGC